MLIEQNIFDYVGASKITALVRCFTIHYKMMDPKRQL